MTTHHPNSETAMRTLFFVFALALGAALPLHASAPVSSGTLVDSNGTAARLVRYAYEVSWAGGTGLVPSGTVGVSVIVDAQHDQQRVQLVRHDGELMGQLVQQGTMAFVGATGQNMEPTFDLMVGAHFLGAPVGLATLVDWAQARDGRGPVAKASVSYSDEGIPVTLNEEGWQVRYDSWTQAQGLEVPVPQQWSIVNEGGLVMKLKLVAAEAYSQDTVPADYNPIHIL